MANELPVLKGFEVYKDIMLAQEEALFHILKKQSQLIADQEQKLINAKKTLLASLEKSFAELPSKTTLASSFDEVFKGFKTCNKVEEDHVSSFLIRLAQSLQRSLFEHGNAPC